LQWGRHGVEQGIDNSAQGLSIHIQPEHRFYANGGEQGSEDRLIDVLPASFRQRAAAAPPVLVVPIGTLPAAQALKVGEELRAAGVATEVEAAGRALRKSLERAGRLGARWVVLLGEDEVGREAVTVKDLKAGGEQHEVPRAALPTYLATRMEPVESTG